MSSGSAGPSVPVDDPGVRPPLRLLPVLVFGQFAGGSLWFAGNAVLEPLCEDLGFPPGSVGELTAAVQVGFMVGTLVFAFLNLADRHPPERVFLVSALGGALANLAVVLLAVDLGSLILLRFLTGVSLAGVYPVGMKIAASWYRRGLGGALGYLVGALVVGKSFPHFLRALGQDWAWQTVFVSLSLLAASGGILLVLLVRTGPYLGHHAPFNPRAIGVIFRSASFRSSALGYFGHMWELYAFWTFVPLWAGVYLARQPDLEWNVSLLTGWVIAVGGLSCVAGGALSRRFGSARVASVQLVTSALLCGLSPLLLERASPFIFLAGLTLWGLVVVGDSPQFSALNALTAPRDYVGSALTIVTCVGFLLTVPAIELAGALLERGQAAWIYVSLAPGPVLGWISLRRAVREERERLRISERTS